MKTAIIIGTRPEIIKMAPVIREFQRRNADFFIVHTGQHYSYNIAEVFFKQLELPQPKYNLAIGSGSHAEETGRILLGVEKLLEDEKPDVVLVEGDTNTVLAGALAAAKLHIKVGHIEAGLRSYDKSMPEETNRTLTDHCSDYLFAPTKKAKEILLSEGIPIRKIYVTGNPIVDSIFQNMEAAKKRSNVLHTLRLSPGEYFLVTLHRQENVDNQTRFAPILKGLDKVVKEFHLPVIYPIHPRSLKMMNRFKLRPNDLRIIDPLDYLSFLQLESNAQLIFTDSGGVQEESCILRVPCVTIRDNTERPEAIEVGANILVDATPDGIVRGTSFMLNKDKNWGNPFGDGEAARRIIHILEGEQ
ncbi:non-hydrolyzing UDP-N-acetylglucosamine 2-epimerase [Chloroflexota bacterium]